MKVNKSEVITCRQDNRNLTLEEIGKRFGITREYARQILKKANMPTTHEGYGKTIANKVCPICGGRKHYQARTCAICGRKKHIVELPCCNCGKTFSRRKCDYERNLGKYNERNYHYKGNGYKGKTFCSRHCFGVWLGKTHGGSKVKQLKAEIQALKEQLAKLTTMC